MFGMLKFQVPETSCMWIFVEPKKFLKLNYALTPLVNGMKIVFGYGQ